MGDRAWAQFQTQMKHKRVQKKSKADAGGGAGIIHQRGELTVQRLSSEVAGKAQKFSRIGAREFVPFDYEDITLANIKLACEKHFSPTVGKSVLCDVLAGEQGPSCSTTEQIPDLRLIHIRFIQHQQEHEERHVENNSGSFSTPEIPKKKRATVSSVPIASSSFDNDSTSPWSPKGIKVFPKSLSVSDMMKLGKVIKKKATTLIELRTFELDPMGWSLTATTVEFNIEKDPFGKGGFREAYRATSHNEGFAGSTWVVKKYLPEALKTIEETGQTAEIHTKKVVQMHTLAKNFADQLAQKIKKDDLLEFGQALQYGKLYFGKELDSGEFVTVEEYIEGDFVKYLNNNGMVCAKNSPCSEKAECLAHFSYEKSGRKLMVLDIQGTVHKVYDPEIASLELIDKDEFLFCTGNLSQTAIEGFISYHSCNIYCKSLGLPELKE